MTVRPFFYDFVFLIHLNTDPQASGYLAVCDASWFEQTLIFAASSLSILISCQRLCVRSAQHDLVVEPDICCESTTSRPISNAEFGTPHADREK